MPWVKIDTGFARHRKVMSVSPQDRWVHISAMCWVGENSTDGVIPRAVIDVIAPGARRAAKRLVQAGLWDEHPDGWCLHDWLDYNITAEEAARNRATKAERQRQWRQKRDAARQAAREHRDTTRVDGLHDAPHDGNATHHTTVTETVSRVGARADVDPTRPDPTPSSNEEGRGGEEEREPHASAPQAAPPPTPSPLATATAPPKTGNPPAGLVPIRDAITQAAANGSPVMAAVLRLTNHSQDDQHG